MEQISIKTMTGEKTWCSTCGRYMPTVECVTHQKKHTETVDVFCARHVTKRLNTYERPRPRVLTMEMITEAVELIRLNMGLRLGYEPLGMGNKF